MREMTGGGSCLQSCRSSGKPAWLQATLADLDRQLQTLALNLPEEDDSDSFAERAENYYRKRPQLIYLLQDLYNRYLTLADRYCQTLKHQSQISTVHSDTDDDVNTTDRPITINCNLYPDSDAESCLSYQPPPQLPAKNPLTPDNLIAELVMKTVEAEILTNELEILDRQQVESGRKMELQKSLLEVLESERMVLLSENARLGYQAAAITEENKELASEAVFMKRKATELARCMLKMRDDHRVCMLSRKIEDLQGQIYGLEKRNKEYYELLVRREEEKKEIVKGVWVEVEKLRLENARLKEEALRGKDGWGRVGKWWGRVRKVEFVVPLCGSQHGRCF
ncbi:kinase-interacting family protein-like [Magnolia sinica]|uniref:kinase-interacting family protein-like n=1 Tax=Magnolia sinica TaxID=86752 RepID=UPI00265A465E|nr:kinase-interacting family protein-like [Magnolia sinica]XP_058090379.1 kinase-interacting family protein-like [Magnolia sinica]